MKLSCHRDKFGRKRPLSNMQDFTATLITLVLVHRCSFDTRAVKYKEHVLYTIFDILTRVVSGSRFRLAWHWRRPVTWAEGTPSAALERPKRRLNRAFLLMLVHELVASVAWPTGRTHQMTYRRISSPPLLPVGRSAKRELSCLAVVQKVWTSQRPVLVWVQFWTADRPHCIPGSDLLPPPISFDWVVVVWKAER